MLNSRALARLLTASLVLLLSACSQQKSSGINITGSTSVSPFAEHLAEMYEEHSGGAINIQSLGSSAGIQAAIPGSPKLACLRANSNQRNPPSLIRLVIARDALAIVVHPSNSVGLTTKQIVDIFSGVVTNWSKWAAVQADHADRARSWFWHNGAFAELVMKEGRRRARARCARDRMARFGRSSRRTRAHRLYLAGNRRRIDQRRSPSTVWRRRWKRCWQKSINLCARFFLSGKKANRLPAAQKRIWTMCLARTAQQELRQLGLVPMRLKLA